MSIRTSFASYIATHRVFNVYLFVQQLEVYMLVAERRGFIGIYSNLARPNVTGPNPHRSNQIIDVRLCELSSSIFLIKLYVFLHCLLTHGVSPCSTPIVHKRCVQGGQQYSLAAFKRPRSCYLFLRKAHKIPKKNSKLIRLVSIQWPTALKTSTLTTKLRQSRADVQARAFECK